MIVIGALAIVALAIGLLFEVSHGSASAAQTQTQTQTVAPVPSPTPSATPAARTSAPIAHAAPPAPTIAPSAAPEVEGKPKHIDTPTDILKWSLMRAIRVSEPAVIDCLDKAKAANTTVDGAALYAFYVTNKDGKAVISRPSMEQSPFPAEVNTCVMNALATGELDQPLPEGQNEFKVLRLLVVEKNAITQYKLRVFNPVP